VRQLYEKLFLALARATECRVTELTLQNLINMLWAFAAEKQPDAKRFMAWATAAE